MLLTILFLESYALSLAGSVFFLWDLHMMASGERKNKELFLRPKTGNGTEGQVV